MSKRNPDTLGVWGPNGTRVVAAESMWREPLKWNKAAREAGERRRVFCASLADVFEDWQGPMIDSQGRTLHLGAGGAWFNTQTLSSKPLSIDDVRERLFGLIDRTPDLDWLLLTKRPENVIPTLERLGNTSALVDCWMTETTLPRNIWLGVSAEDQRRANERIPILLDIPAAVRFVSAEPLLGPIDFRPWLDDIGWIIVGGESGKNHRPMDLEWLASIVEQCRYAGVPCYVKQDSAFRDSQQGRISDELWSVKEFPAI